MNHRRMFTGLTALSFAAAVYAAPTGPINRVMDAGPPVSPQSLITVSNYRLSTGFEAVDGWDLNSFICGNTFLNCPVARPIPGVCAPKNHVASLNCCFNDPNEDTGWWQSGSSQHCNEPSIRDINPFNPGGYHLRNQYDPQGGNPAGCSGNLSRCRSTAFSTTGVPFQAGPISRVQTSYEIDMDGILGTSLVQGWGTYVPPAVAFHDYIYWYYLGSIYNYSLYYNAFIFAGYWDGSLLTPPDPTERYINHSADFDPCRNTVTYSLRGQVYFVEPYGFTHPNGAPGDRATASAPPGNVTNAEIIINLHFPGTTVDFDDVSAVATECPDACCNGEDGSCVGNLDAAGCAALGGQASWYENTPCDMLGMGVCLTATYANCVVGAAGDAFCGPFGPCTAGLGWPDACLEHTGACCDRSPGAGGPGAEGACTDGTDQEDDCTGDQLTWYKGLTCAEVECMEDVGSCCNLLTGQFIPGITTFQSACLSENPAQRVWTKGDILGEAPCSAVLGACCDADTFGTCSSTTQAGCNCSTCTWNKLQSCDDITCTHAAIPTVSAWGLAVLTLLLLTGAKVYFGRRQAVA